MPLSEEEAEAIAETMTIKEYPKGAILLREGLISEDCVRQYHIVDGEEKTSNFFTDEQWILSINSFSQMVPSNPHGA